MKEGFKLLQRVLLEKDTSIIGDEAGSVYALPLFRSSAMANYPLPGALIEQRRLMPLF